MTTVAIIDTLLNVDAIDTFDIRIFMVLQICIFSINNNLITVLYNGIDIASQ